MLAGQRKGERFNLLLLEDGEWYLEVRGCGDARGLHPPNRPRAGRTFVRTCFRR